MEIPDAVKGAIFLPVGIGLLIGAGYSVSSTQDYRRRTLMAPGIVVAERYGPHHVDVRFQTNKGVAITYMQGGDVTLHTGERVVVLYDPLDPKMDPSVDHWGAIWGTTVFLTVFGSLFTIVASLMLAKQIRTNRATAKDLKS